MLQVAGNRILDSDVIRLVEEVILTGLEFGLDLPPELLGHGFGLPGGLGTVLSVLIIAHIPANRDFASLLALDFLGINGRHLFFS